ncbi:autotransporter outer membrane beta-barrel domain-containing protein [Spirosoma radiotolerans]|uniref:hypothetical protein n=1 Tax=Spirosoma radiotolerans TaxID=1379870 RepID=UPI0006980D4A|nr:hypothetical protein [Spirosoma radiotolerans]
MSSSHLAPLAYLLSYANARTPSKTNRQNQSSQPWLSHIGKRGVAYWLICLLPGALWAQPTNYVANVANATAPATNNTFIGPQAGQHSSGYDNVLIGYQTGDSSAGHRNLFVGYQAGLINTGDYNIFIGASTGVANTSGSNNQFIGEGAGAANTTGGSNTFIGSSAGLSNRTGSSNCFIGYWAGLYNTTGVANTFLGASAGNSNQTGTNNTFVGTGSGSQNNTGQQNTFLGQAAGGSNTQGSQNTFVGAGAGYRNTTGSSNTLVGHQAGQYITTGSHNIIVGPNSGTAITDGSENVLMGYNSQAEDGIFNGIAIGSNSRVASSNALILGNGVNVGIGTSAPTDRLEVVGPSADKSGLRLTKLTTASPTQRTTDEFLTVDERGEVVKAKYQLRINQVSEWSDHVFSSGYSLRTLSAVAAYVGQHGHLPGVPSAEQVIKEGVDLVKMNATLLEKVEELTLYSIEQDQKAQRQGERITQLEQLVRQLLEKK